MAGVVEHIDGNDQVVTRLRVGGEIQRLVDVEQGIRHLRFIMETGSGVIENCAETSVKWYDCRVFRVAFSTGAVVAAVPAPTSESVLRCTRRQSARYSDSDRRWRGCRDTARR